MTDDKVTKERVRRVWAEELRLGGEAVRLTLRSIGAAAQEMLDTVATSVDETATRAQSTLVDIAGAATQFSRMCDEAASFFVAARVEVNRRG